MGLVAATVRLARNLLIRRKALKGSEHTRLRTRFAILACACCISPALSQTPGSCAVVDPELQGSYVGGCVDGRAHGFGEARGSATYRGQFAEGRKQGTGEKTWPSGDRYEGQFVEDRKSGTGTYVWGSGSSTPGEKYSGDWLDDRRNGHGVYEWPNGDRYDGPWKDDRIAGPPTQAMIDRARIEAERAAAIGRPGARVCREMTVGIATKDLVRGTVQSLADGRIDVLIDDAGKFEHVIANKTVRKGDVVSDAPRFWMPCA